MEYINKVSGKTKVIALIGNPIQHSISPQLHNIINQKLGVDLIYVPFKVNKSELANAVKGLKALNVLGFNITVPYKKEVMKYIDDNIRETFLLGAINTVKNIEGRFYGYNTDGEGFLRSFKEEQGHGFKGKNVLIMGAGGVARPIAVKIALEGAKKISIVNRTVTKAVEIAEVINDNIKNIATAYSFLDETFEKVFRESEIVINTTSVGMYPDVFESPLINVDYFGEGQIVYDVIYNPSKTKFLSDAENKGCKIINGFGMLFYQAIFAYEIWTGIKLNEDFIKEIFEEFLLLTSKIC